MNQTITFQSLFTEPDDSITGEQSSDPLGLQPIWTHFGQAIFNRKLTSVSTELRNYTINLFHHFVIYSLEREERDLFNTNVERDSWGSRGRLKAGMIIFLEDLFVYSILASESDIDTFSREGLPGFNKGASRWTSNGTSIRIEMNPEGGILSRQIGLGINGRYKGPFIQLGFHNSDYDYDLEKWTDIENQLIGSNPQMIALVSQLKELIKLVLSKAKSEAIAGISLSKIDFLRQVGLNYSELFPRKVKPPFSDFWLKQLGLKEGAAGAIFSQTRLRSQWESPKQIFIDAQESVGKGSAAFKRIQNVIEIEDFLRRVDYLFELLLSPEFISIEAILQTGWVTRVLSTVNLQEIEPISRIHPRLALLFEALRRNIGNEDILMEELLDYHREIMDERRSFPWVEQQNGKLKRYTKIKSKVSIFEPDGEWGRNYYLWTVWAFSDQIE